MEKWEYLKTGNVVRWNKRLWIVSEVTSRSVELIAFDSTNVLALPTTEWPDNPDHRVDSIEWIADNARDRLIRTIDDAMVIIKEEE